MKIGGFQKLTLLDYPGNTACIVFTEGCNFRCPFCHNSGLVLPDGGGGTSITEEVFAYLEKRRGILDGVVVTGGEPLLQAGLADFLGRVRGLGYQIKLDTNGSFPSRLEALLREKLVDYVAMDIKHTPEKYELAVGTRSGQVVPLVRESLELLRASGLPFELRTTAVKGIHVPEDFPVLAAWIAGDQPYYLQSYADSGSVLAPEGLSGFSREELEIILKKVKKYCPRAELRM